MPDLIAHYYFGESVLSALDEPLRARIDPKIYGFTCAGPDVWFSLGFLGGRDKPYAVRGTIMQHEKCGAYLLALADEAKNGGDARDALFSYLAGFLCHYCLDSRCHPYIETMTGNYDGTERTRCYRGAHTRLERAIDSHILREKYGFVPWHFPFRKRVLRLRALPESLRAGLNRAHERVYGWEGCFDQLQRCVRDQRRFYALMKDPLGLLTPLLRLADNGKSTHDLPGLTYHGKDIDGAVVDYLNEGRKPWRHFCDTSIESTDGFWTLFEKARGDCLGMIGACRAYVYENGPSPAAVIGDRCYETGFACDDPRNGAEQHYEPIF